MILPVLIPELVLKKEDKHKFDAAWDDLAQDKTATAQVLEGAAQLARAHKTKPVQGKHFKDVQALMDEAE